MRVSLCKRERHLNADSQTGDGFRVNLSGQARVLSRAKDKRRLRQYRRGRRQNEAECKTAQTGAKRAGLRRELNR